MAAYRCRVVLPVAYEWLAIEASSPEHAAQECHHVQDGTITDHRIRLARPGGGHEYVHLVSVEVEGHGEWVSRMFHCGIYRKGGVGSTACSAVDESSRCVPSLAELCERAAKAIGWKRDPMELIEDDWDLESEAWS